MPRTLRLLAFPVLLAVGTTHGAAAVNTSTPSFLQEATTVKRDGPPPPPDEPSALVGAPTTPQRTQESSPGVMPMDVPNVFDAAVQPVAPGAPQDHEVAPTAPPPPPAPPVTAGPPRAVSGSSGITLRFSNAPIESVVQAIMEELRYTYVIDPDVGGTVNLYTMGEISRDKIFSVLEQLLRMNGQAIVRQEDLYIILPIGKSPKVPHEILLKTSPGPREERQGSPPGVEPAQPPAETPPPEESTLRQEVSGGPVVLSLGPSSPQNSLEGEQGVITYIIPLNYLPSSDMLMMITPFVSEGATVIDFAPGNMLLVTDYHQNIQQVLNLVRLLDTEYFDIHTVELLAIRHNNAKDVAEDLGKIFAPGDRATGVRIVAIERLNSLLVVTHSPAVLEEVRNWTHKLDAPSANTNIKTFVYQVENNTAMNIAEILAQLYQDGQGLPSAPVATEQDPRGQQGRGMQREAGFLGQGQMGGQLGPTLGARNVQAGIRSVVSGNVKIIANEFNNSLIIQSTEADYNFLLETIRQLDVLPRQVLIEAKIYAVELRDDLSFGVAAFLQERGFNGPATTGQMSPAEKPGQLQLSTRTIVGQTRQLDAIITALRSRTNVEIVEAPRLLAMDGMQAQINVGAEVPVTTASFGDPLRAGTPTSFINSIQFRSTGTTLLIVPRISASGIVTMDLAIEVSSPSGSSLTPTINRNYVTTSMIVRDGQTAAIGGIISDHFSLDRDRVPVLGDIPILGALFGNTVRSKRRAELLFLITPHVIRNLPTATELMLDFRRALRNAHDFIERMEAEEQRLIEDRRRRELERNSN